MNQDQMMQLFKDTGMVLEGHFILTSGKHSPTFLQCSQLMQYPEHTETAMKALAEKFKDTDAQVVVGPAMGGVILAYELARQLGLKAMYTEKDDQGGMVFRRGFRLAPGTKVLIVEDALSTGGSIKRAMIACEYANLDIVGVAVLVDRSAGKVKLHENQHSLVTMSVPAYDPEDCPICKENKPLTHPKDLSM